MTPITALFPRWADGSGGGHAEASVSFAERCNRQSDGHRDAVRPGGRELERESSRRPLCHDVFGGWDGGGAHCPAYCWLPYHRAGLEKLPNVMGRSTKDAGCGWITYATSLRQLFNVSTWQPGDLTTRSHDERPHTAALPHE